MSTVHQRAYIVVIRIIDAFEIHMGEIGTENWNLQKRDVTEAFTVNLKLSESLRGMYAEDRLTIGSIT